MLRKFDRQRNLRGNNKSERKSFRILGKENSC